MKMLTNVLLFLCCAVPALAGDTCKGYSKCPQGHCGSVAARIKKTCSINNWNHGHYVIDEYPSGSGSYCCCACSCFAYGTPVIMDDGVRKIEDIRVGDTLQVFDLATEQWINASVTMSEGTSSASFEDNAIFLNYTLYNTTKYIITDILQPFLVYIGEERKVLQAYQMDRSLHKLVNANNLKPVRINHISWGRWNGGLWSISVTQGQFFNANGIIASDYSLQASIKSTRIKEPNIYEQTLCNKKSSFVPYHCRAMNAPEESNRFLPNDIANPTLSFYRHKFNPESETLQIDNANQLISLFARTYPEISFTIIWDSWLVNVYSWKNERGKKIVNIHGGFVRHSNIGWAGLGIAIASQIAYLHDDIRVKSNPCYLDYLGSMAIMRNVYRHSTERSTTLYANLSSKKIEHPWKFAIEGSNQMSLFLNNIQDPFYEGYLSCKINSIIAGIRLNDYPNCIIENDPYRHLGKNIRSTSSSSSTSTGTTKGFISKASASGTTPGYVPQKENADAFGPAPVSSESLKKFSVHTKMKPSEINILIEVNHQEMIVADKKNNLKEKNAAAEKKDPGESWGAYFKRKSGWHLWSK